MGSNHSKEENNEKKQIMVLCNGLIYSLNTREKKASVLFNKNAHGDILIPRSINHKGQEYIITRLEKRVFENLRNIYSIQFMPDSELQTIGEYAFHNSSIENISIPQHVTRICQGAFAVCNHLKQVEIPENSELQVIESYAFIGAAIESLTIPSKLVEMQEGWCFSTCDLRSVRVSENNQFFKSIDDKIVLGKTNPKSDEFDMLVFVCRDTVDYTIQQNIKKIASGAFSGSKIESVTIPSKVSEICNGAFYLCRKLQRVEIQCDSELTIIGKEAFFMTSIKRIFIPRRVKRICEGAFSGCQQLERVEIQENSELQIIEKKAFENSSIESLMIPSSVVSIEDKWCCRTERLKNVKVNENNQYFKSIDDKIILSKTDQKSDNFDVLVFVNRDIKQFTTQPYISRIGFCAFDHSSIRKIKISAGVKEICNGAFKWCSNLRFVEIPINSELTTIGKSAFKGTNIERIEIPSKVREIGENAFAFCDNLKRVEIPENSELQIIGKNAFVCSRIQSIFIPEHVSDICVHSFQQYNDLRLIEFGGNVNLKSFEKGEFDECLNIMIPCRKNLSI